MSSLEKTIKETIARVVRKETAALRDEVADLRKQLRALSKEYADYCKLDGASWNGQFEFNDMITGALCDAWKSLEEQGVIQPAGIVEVEGDEAEDAKTDKKLSPKAITKIRIKTGLSQVQFSQLLDIPSQTYNLWERGKTSPRKANVAKLLELQAMGKREIKKLIQEKGIELKKRGKKATKAAKASETSVAK